MATEPPLPQDTSPEAARRLGLRRARTAGGFSSSSSTVAETLRSPQDLEDEDLNAEVRGQIPRLPPPPSTAPSDDPDENRRRLVEAAMAGDASFAREFRLNLLHKLLMRGISLDNIAREMGVSISTVKNDRTELRRRLRENAKGLDIYELIGEQKAFYDEATAMSLRIVSQQGMPTPMRLAGIRTALAAKADQTRFLASAGVFDVLAFRRQEDGQDLSDVQVLMSRTEDLLNRLVAEEEEQPSTPRRPPKPPSRVMRRRSGGFNAMSFDDADASGSQNEVQEL